MLIKFISPRIRDKADMWRHVLSVATGCVGISVGIEALIDFALGTPLSSDIRGLVTAFVLSGILSGLTSLAISRSHLALYEAKQAAELASLTDPLTGLMNRRALTQRLESLPNVTLILALADIDFFKRVNDTLGHRAGDRVIEAVGRMLAEELAEFGPLARVGGEEFALLASGAPSEAILARLEDARRRIAATPVVADGLAVRVTISAGLATGGKENRFETLYAQADQALYAAKTSGRNRVLKFEPGREPAISAELTAAAPLKISA